MAATFVLEDGTGLATANAYAAEAAVDQYAENYMAAPTDWTALASAVKQLHIRTSTRHLDANFAVRWKGTRANETQALDWPRVGVHDESGYSLDSDALPAALVTACCQFSIEASTAELLPNATASGSVKRVKEKLGPLETETEYLGGSEQSTQFRLASRLLNDLLEDSCTMERA